MQAILIPADPAKPIADVEHNGSLDALQALVGGYIQTIPWPSNSMPVITPYFNEEGKVMNLARNERATQLLEIALLPGDYIAGDLVLTGTDRGGQTVDCPVPAAAFADR